MPAPRTRAVSSTCTVAVAFCPAVSAPVSVESVSPTLVLSTTTGGRSARVAAFLSAPSHATTNSAEPSNARAACRWPARVEKRGRIKTATDGQQRRKRRVVSRNVMENASGRREPQRHRPVIAYPGCANVATPSDRALIRCGWDRRDEAGVLSRDTPPFFVGISRATSITPQNADYRTADWRFCRCRFLSSKDCPTSRTTRAS